MYFFLALLFHFPIVIDSVLVPAFKRGKPPHNPTCLTTWLQTHHTTCLWSALFYTLTLSVAAFLQKINNQSSGLYENYSIIQAIKISSGSQLLILAAYYEKFTRLKFFGMALLVTTVLGAYPTLWPALSDPKWSEDFIGACKKYMNTHEVPPGTTIIGSYTTTARTELFTSLFGYVILFCAWWSLRWLQSGTGRSYSIVASSTLSPTLGILILNLYSLS